jgi:hypothetical protein
VSTNKGSDPIRQQHCSRLQARQELAREPVVVRLTGRQCEPDRQAIGIDQCMKSYWSTRLDEATAKGWMGHETRLAHDLPRRQRAVIRHGVQDGG